MNTEYALVLLVGMVGELGGENGDDDEFQKSKINIMYRATYILLFEINAIHKYIEIFSPYVGTLYLKRQYCGNNLALIQNIFKSRF